MIPDEEEEEAIRQYKKKDIEIVINFNY